MHNKTMTDFNLGNKEEGIKKINRRNRKKE